MFLALLFSTIHTHAAEPAPSLALLTNAQQVLDLGVEGARRSPHPVKFTGGVTYPVFNRVWFYVQDGTAGVLVVQTNVLRVRADAGGRRVSPPGTQPTARPGVGPTCRPPDRRTRRTIRHRARACSIA